MGQTLNLAHITRDYFHQYYLSGETNRINQGMCMNWAMAAYHHYSKRGHTVRLHSVEIQLPFEVGYHAVIEIDGMFYDSESPFGEECIANLKCVRRAGGIIIQVITASDPQDFTTYWRPLRLNRGQVWSLWRVKILSEKLRKNRKWSFHWVDDDLA